MKKDKIMLDEKVKYESCPKKVKYEYANYTTESGKTVKEVIQHFCTSPSLRQSAVRLFKGKWALNTFKEKLCRTNNFYQDGVRLNDSTKDKIVIHIANEVLKHFAKDYTGEWAPWVIRPLTHPISTAICTDSTIPLAFKNTIPTLDVDTAVTLTPTIIRKYGETNMKNLIEKRKYFRDMRVDSASPKELISHIRQLKQEIKELLDLADDSTYVDSEIKIKEKAIKKLLKILDNHESQ